MSKQAFPSPSTVFPAAALITALVAVLTAATASAAQPLIIPAKAPDGKPSGWCGTGRLSPSEYQTHWTGWRNHVIEARIAGDSQCEGLAFTELALLTERQDIGHLGQEYWQAALAILEPALGKDDPRLVQILLRLSDQRWNPDQGNVAAETLVRRVIEILEAPPLRPEDLPPLSCKPEDAAAAGDVLSIENLSRSRLAYEGQNRGATLTAAFERLSRLYIAAGRHRDAIAALDRGLAVLETRERTAKKSEHWNLTWQARETIRQLANITKQDPSIDIDPSIVERGIGLVQRTSGGKTLELGKALGALANIHTARGDVAAAESTLHAGLKAMDGGEESLGGHLSRNTLVRQLRDTYRRQKRWGDIEALLLEDLAATEASAPDQPALLSLPPKITRPLQQLAYFYRERSRPVDELGILLRLADANPKGYHVHWQLGRIRQQLGQLPVAEASYLHSLELLRPQVKPSNTNQINPLLGLAEIYRLQGREAHELDILRQAEDVYDHLFAEKDGNPAPVSLWGKARVLFAGRRFAEAEDLYRRAEAGILADPDAHRADLATPRQGLARVAVARGNRSSALAFLRSAVAAFEDAYGDVPERLARGLRGIAKTSRELGLEDEARALEARAESADQGYGT